MFSQGTSGYFSDTETSAGNSMTAWVDTAVILLNDGFEGDPWDANWDDNGATGWSRDSKKSHSGGYSVICEKDSNGYLTSDDLDASGATSITVSFWFSPHSAEAGDMLVQLYNGSTYVSWGDLIDYPTSQNNSWCYFSEEITDSQYFNTDFRLRFDGSALLDKNESYHIDDVLITM